MAAVELRSAALVATPLRWRIILLLLFVGGAGWVSSSSSAGESGESSVREVEMAMAIASCGFFCLLRFDAGDCDGGFFIRDCIELFSDASCSNISGDGCMGFLTPMLLQKDGWSAPCPVTVLIGDGGLSFGLLVFLPADQASVEMAPSYDYHDLVRVSTGACCSWWPQSVVVATEMAWRGFYVWYWVCGSRWSNQFVFSVEHGWRRLVRGSGGTGKIPDQCATEEKFLSSTGSSFGSQSSWTAMVFPRIR